MTNSEYKLMEHMDQAFDSLVSAANIAHCDRHPEAAAISEIINSLEDVTSSAWQRFRTEDKS